MAFDPLEFGPDPGGAAPPPTPAAGGFNPDDFGPAPPAGPAPSGLEAFGRGALQGVSFGLADEITGALESLLSDKTYEEARDASRANYKAAETAHPWLSVAGNVAGSIPTAFVPGLNVAKGAGLAKTALNLGAQGAAAGFGASEGATAGEMLSDTALGGILGAGIGAAAHGVGKLISKAPELAKLDRAAAVVEGDSTHGRATATGGTSAKGHVAKLVGSGLGALAGGVGGPIGHVAGAVIGAEAGTHAQAALTQVRSAALRQLESYNAKVAQLTEAAAGGDANARMLLGVIHGSPEIAAKVAALNEASK